LITYVTHFNILKSQIIDFLRSIQESTNALLNPPAIEDARRGLEALLDFVPISEDNIFGTGGVRATSISVS
jgi:hypothetical protein